MSRVRAPNPVTNWLTEHARVSVAALGRHCRMPIATMLTALVIGITLALPAALDLMVRNLHHAAGGINQSRTFSVFLNDQIGEERGRLFAQEIAEWPDVESARYTSRDEALENFRSQTDMGPILDALPDNPLPASIALTPKTSTSSTVLEQIALSLKDRQEVDHLQVDHSWSERLAATLNIATTLTLLLAVGLGIAAILAMGNTIRLDIEARREEIAVMKLIGASARFIRRPFLYAGIWYGVAGGLVAIAALFIARAIMQGPVDRLMELYGSSFEVIGPTIETLFVVLAAGVLLGLIGAWVAVARHMRGTTS